MARSNLNIFLTAHGYAIVVAGIFVVAFPIIASQGDALIGISVPSWIRFVGLSVIVLSGALSYSSFWLFMTRGKATALPTDAPTKMLVFGPYRYVRNPMYIGNIGMVFGSAMFFRSPGILAYAIALCMLTHLYVVLHEEPRLLVKFGNDYQTYRTAVRRWWPSLFPYSQNSFAGFS